MIEQVTVNMSDSEDKQVIAALDGMLKQQERYTNNAVRECMRLRAIIAKCDRCRNEANAELSGGEAVRSDDLLKMANVLLWPTTDYQVTLSDNA